MSKTIAYVALHYGKPYLSYAIQSVIDAIDELHILYTDKPSHGSSAVGVCPDTEDDLHAISWDAAGLKLRWHKNEWTQEYQQRNSIAQYAPDADTVLILDSDECWNEATLKLLDRSQGYQGAYITIPMYHFYHNFRHAMIHDLAAPPRILFPKAPNRGDYKTSELEEAIAHFGYCQPVEYIRYKLSCHGHKHELRFTPDEYVAMYLDRDNWHDLHPVGHQWDVADEVKPLNYMPALMQQHPYFNLEWVE